MANFRAITTQGGNFKQQQDADTLIVGRGITTDAGNLEISAAGGGATILAGTVLGTTGTGNINLPNNGSARFQVEGVSVGATVTAAALGTLTNGSNADALHVHNASGITGVSFTATAGENLDIGELVSMDDSAGNPRAFKADANGVADLQNVIGIVVASATTGNPVTIRVAGEQAIPDSEWDAVPGTGNVGDRVYLSTTSGNWTLTAPSTAGDYAVHVGIVTRGGVGAVKAVLQIGEGVII